MSGIPRSREGELLKKEKGPLGAKWTRKLVVVDGRKGTVRYHRPTDDKSDVPRKIFHLKSMTLIEDCIGPKKAPHALELRDLKGYSLILACERGAAEKRPGGAVSTLMCRRDTSRSRSPYDITGLGRSSIKTTGGGRALARAADF